MQKGIGIKKSILVLLTAFSFVFSVNISELQAKTETTIQNDFKVGEKDFLLNGQPLQIRCGELHFARVPREYWRHRLQMCKAMGLNTVCAYLFWNYHEWEQGKYNWSGNADVAEFCRMAQQEGLWVILRPGPYSCAEWEMGGFPWWLLKKDDIQLRTRDPYYIEQSKKWLKEVGSQLGSLQVTKGGPILMVQVENEYGFYGDDAEYMGVLRQALIDGGFDVPLFACNPTWNLDKAFRKDLLLVANFGSDPAKGFEQLKKVQPNAPLMCGEFYPAWFDVWGSKHRTGSIDTLVKDLEIMLDMGGSFSIYMVHGGTSFGLWAGADQPFKPDTSSYDYDAPISEAGWETEKFMRVKDLFAKHLLPGESIPEIPERNPVISIDSFQLQKAASILDTKVKPVKSAQPLTFETMDLGHGCAVYETTIPSGSAGILQASAIHDFGFVFLDGKRIGVTDRRARRFSVNIPARDKDSKLQILVYTMGRVNFGKAVHDRKGIHGPVRFIPRQGSEFELTNWEIYKYDMGQDNLPNGLKYKDIKKLDYDSPKFYSGSFKLKELGDSFLDMRPWGKGVVWVNGHCLGRYWNIGPTQTMYLPAPWLKKGENSILILDVLGPQEPVVKGLKKPILDVLRPELDFAITKRTGKLNLSNKKPIMTGTFIQGAESKQIKFRKSVKATQFSIQSLNAYNDVPYAAIGELDVLDQQGNSISHALWRIAYVDSEEVVQEANQAENAIDGQTANFWHTNWSAEKTGHPHTLVIDLGKEEAISGFKYVPRQGDDNSNGRIKDYKIFVGNNLVTE